MTISAAESKTENQSPIKNGGGATRPTIVLVIPRGEAVRNFLYSDTLPTLAGIAQVVILSVVDDTAFTERFEDHAAEILPLKDYPQPTPAAYLRVLTENAHDRRQWSRVHQNHWQLRDQRAAANGRMLQRRVVKGVSRLLANAPSLRLLTRLEQELAYRLRPTREFEQLFARLQPALVFNGSHIHGVAGELPVRVAHRMGIPTAGFIFSWDNLTSRSRIFVPYDHYLVWHEGMQRELQTLYPWIAQEHISITGTPQFDFHSQSQLVLSREELCQRIGLDPARPYLLYTTGIANHFYDEHLHVGLVIRLLRDLDLDPRPQLVVRTYVKGTSPEMLALAESNPADVVFPKVLWEPRWQTPLYEDLQLYTNLLRHCAVGINAASTVTLELLQFDKPVINLDFDPPGSDLPWELGYDRHIQFDHYRPVAQSGAVMVARSEDDMRLMLQRGLTKPNLDSPARRRLLEEMFGGSLDGRAGQRVADTLFRLAAPVDS